MKKHLTPFLIPLAILASPFLSVPAMEKNAGAAGQDRQKTAAVSAALAGMRREIFFINYFQGYASAAFRSCAQ